MKFNDNTRAVSETQAKTKLKSSYQTLTSVSLVLLFMVSRVTSDTQDAIYWIIYNSIMQNRRFTCLFSTMLWMMLREMCSQMFNRAWSRILLWCSLLRVLNGAHINIYWWNKLKRTFLCNKWKRTFCSTESSLVFYQFYTEPNLDLLRTWGNSDCGGSGPCVNPCWM